MLTVGITGSLGSGKSTVASLLAQTGAKVLDADKLAHGFLKRGHPCFGKIVRRFGPTILKAGRIDRRKLAQIIFGDPRALADMNKIVHPVLKKEIAEALRRLARSKKRILVIVDAALLFEMGMNRWLDCSIVVKAPLAVQLQRIVRKGVLTREEALGRIRFQMPLKEKLKMADMVIDNSHSLQQTQKIVERVWQKLSRLQTFAS